MRIIYAPEFLAIDENVVFAMYTAGQIGPLCIKGQTLEGHGKFLYRQIQPTLPQHRRPDNAMQQLLAVPPVAEVELEFSVQEMEEEIMDRQRFVVWHRHDVQNLVEALAPCMDTVLPELPKEPQVIASYPGVVLATIGKEVPLFYPNENKKLSMTDIMQMLQGLCMYPKLRLGHLDDYSKKAEDVVTTHRLKNPFLRGYDLIADIELLDTPAGQRILNSGGIQFYPKYGSMCGETFLAGLYVHEGPQVSLPLHQTEESVN